MKRCFELKVHKEIKIEVKILQKRLEVLSRIVYPTNKKLYSYYRCEITKKRERPSDSVLKLIQKKKRLYSYYRCEVVTGKTLGRCIEADPNRKGEYAPIFQTCFQTKTNVLCVKLYMRLRVSKNIIKESISQPSGYGIRLSGSLHMWIAVGTSHHT